MKRLLILFIALITICVVYTQLPDKKLHVFICDVGQGDGILLTKGSTQIVIDAGPDNSIEECLGEHMPFWDRTIEVALMTHADSDHSFGFSEMFSRYAINTFIVSPIDPSSPSKTYTNLEKKVEQTKTHIILAKEGDEVKVGDVSFRILFPTADFIEKNSTPKESNTFMGSRNGVTNKFCAITYLSFRRFTALFSCDTTTEIESILTEEHRVPHAFLLKIAHHGAKNGLTKNFLDAVNPQIAAISVGKKNRYGHPSPEVIELLQSKNIKTFRTDRDGEITVSTDGDRVWVQ